MKIGLGFAYVKHFIWTLTHAVLSIQNIYFTYFLNYIPVEEYWFHLNFSSSMKAEKENGKKENNY